MQKGKVLLIHRMADGWIPWVVKAFANSFEDTKAGLSLKLPFDSKAESGRYIFNPAHNGVSILKQFCHAPLCLSTAAELYFLLTDQLQQTLAIVSCLAWGLLHQHTFYDSKWQMLTHTNQCLAKHKQFLRLLTRIGVCQQGAHWQQDLWDCESRTPLILQDV